MKLYHSLLFLLLTIFLAACVITTPNPSTVGAQIEADGDTIQVVLPAGSTVKEALEQAEIRLELLDRIEPPLHTVLSNELIITIDRVWETFEIEQIVLPFEQQLQPSETLPEGEQQPLQLGQNGLQEITYRIVYENDVEVVRSEIKSVIISEPIMQIMLIGVQHSFVPLPIPGRLLYLSDGNAWMLEDTTANRISVVPSGDLDGRIFELSDDGEWLLFTRFDDDEDVINTLWAISIDNPEDEVDLHVQNVIHFADWEPESQSWAAFSTVEPRQAAPGWQANNDLKFRNFSAGGWVKPTADVLLDSNSGGVYGWWGTDFSYGPGSALLAYATPDQVGILNFDESSFLPVMDNIPLQTRSDWAWVPGISWGPDGKVLYTVRHAPSSDITFAEESPNFNLTALPSNGSDPIDLVSLVGMFAYPLPSPLQIEPSGETAHQVAYLQAIFPLQSETSRYRLMIMDRDGSNQYEIFPPSETPGIEPQKNWGVWSPDRISTDNGYVLAVLYQGNIWLIDVETSQTWQITGDGRINRVDWQ
ncbi:MAG: G5 domain-containing protein [Chloroflexi bacterium]|nr:G5 domain-containing protein [Chloroflexota bacterium]